jgi:drug/metabolite transporter (DMT)-like permease
VSPFPDAALVLPLALASSLFSGVSDFAGGMAARHVHILRVLAVTAPASWAVTLALAPVMGAAFTGPAILWGLASGLASVAAFALLYRCLAIGPMGLLSPVAAVISALLPVGVGLAAGEHLSGAATAGMFLATLAVVLVSAGPSTGSSRPSARGVTYAGAAGTAIAIQLVCLDEAPVSSGLAPLIAAGAMSTAVVMTLLAASGTGGASSTLRPAGWALFAGVLGSLANIAFLAAVRHGELSIVAVVTALYPAGTVLLARTVLRERVTGTQGLGLGLAAAAVAAFSLK